MKKDWAKQDGQANEVHEPAALYKANIKPAPVHNDSPQTNDAPLTEEQAIAIVKQTLKRLEDGTEPTFTHDEFKQKIAQGYGITL